VKAKRSLLGGHSLDANAPLPITSSWGYVAETFVWVNLTEKVMHTVVERWFCYLQLRLHSFA